MAPPKGSQPTMSPCGSSGRHVDASVVQELPEHDSQDGIQRGPPPEVPPPWRPGISMVQESSWMPPVASQPRMRRLSNFPPTSSSSSREISGRAGMQASRSGDRIRVSRSVLDRWRIMRHPASLSGWKPLMTRRRSPSQRPRCGTSTETTMRAPLPPLGSQGCRPPLSAAQLAARERPWAPAAAPRRTSFASLAGLKRRRLPQDELTCDVSDSAEWRRLRWHRSSMLKLTPNLWARNVRRIAT
mmetsp:Transcript_123049/g.359215  ORF Transcript_123049/g.359215 Transcript_123049/m.359215 type:complete len:243 (-) Transcript_123049:674-1402(-)